MPAPTSPVGGQDTRAYFNGFTVGVKTWKLGVTLSGEADYTNSESPQDANLITHVNRKPVTKDVLLTMTIVFDKDNPPYAATPNLVTGATLSTTRIYVSKVSTKFYSFPTLIVTEDAVMMQINDILWADVTLKPDGSWSYPS